VRGDCTMDVGIGIGIAGDRESIMVASHVQEPVG